MLILELAFETSAAARVSRSSHSFFDVTHSVLKTNSVMLVKIKKLQNVKKIRQLFSGHSGVQSGDRIPGRVVADLPSQAVKAFERRYQFVHRPVAFFS
jgi:hypothetical protein